MLKKFWRWLIGADVDRCPDCGRPWLSIRQARCPFCQQELERTEETQRKEK